MDARVPNRVVWVVLPIVALLSGCGNYTVTFEVADVINAWGDDVTREMLDVDILCLSKSDARKHPEIISGAVRANQWFKSRDEDDPQYSDISAKRIYALRRGEAGDKRDTLLGESLLSARDREDDRRATTVRVMHPQFFSGESAIVIYGRFTSQTGIAKTPPLVIKPPPGWNTDIVIKVGRTSMSLVE